MGVEIKNPDAELMDELDPLKEFISGLEGAVELYSNEGRQAREVWCIAQFLSILDIPFEDSSIIPVKEDPPDILFRDARFEVKEIQDKGRRRHAEYKERLQKAKTVKSLGELLEPYRPVPLTLGDIAKQIKNDLYEQAKHYAPAVRRSLDIIYYINPRHHFLSPVDGWPRANEFSEHGWRTIGFFKGIGGGILYTSADSPVFLKEIAGRLIRAEGPYLRG